MIVYLDTSAVLPLLVDEPSSAACRRLWDGADDAVSSRLLYVEAAAALSRAKRLGRLTARAHQDSLSGLVALWPQLQIAEVDQQLVERAAALAGSFELRGYDAVHCASAEQLQDDGLVAASGDGRLLRAWQQIGLATYDTNAT